MYYDFNLANYRISDFCWCIGINPQGADMVQQ